MSAPTPKGLVAELVEALRRTLDTIQKAANAFDAQDDDAVQEALRRYSELWADDDLATLARATPEGGADGGHGARAVRGVGDVGGAPRVLRQRPWTGPAPEVRLLGLRAHPRGPRRHRQGRGQAMNVTSDGKFATLRYTYACGHPGESHCQDRHSVSFQRFAREAARGPCADCCARIRAAALKVVQNADGLLATGTSEDAVAWYVHLAAKVPRSAAKELVRRLVARRVLSEEVRT
ncbi:MAG TPA: hypothetical protein VMY76_00690 [Gemmatimonadales bacterium]|nr:hypothetical protein [Gemmatimonadales bacterium]